MREELELMRIVRVPPMGKLVIQMGNKRYEKLSDIEDKRVKRSVITAIGELMGFAGGYQALVDADVAPPLTAQTPSGSIQSKAASLKEQQDRFLETLQQTKERLSASNSTRVTPEAVSPTVNESGAQPTSIIEQINLILQTYVENSEHNGRSIHLIQGAQGSVKIEVDGTIYNKPREIGDPTLQILIKRALKEWEST